MYFTTGSVVVDGADGQRDGLNIVRPQTNC